MCLISSICLSKKKLKYFVRGLNFFDSIIILKF